MNSKQNLQILDDDNMEEFDFDELERNLTATIEDQLEELNSLKKEEEKIANPNALGEVVMQTVIEQFNNQIAATAGKDFIIDNRGLTLDLRDEAHIQTTENFAKGNIATHNMEIDYQERYDTWQSNFQRNDDGTIRTKIDNRTGEKQWVLRVCDKKKDPNGENYNTNYKAREYIDKGRPQGSNTVHKDHTIPAAEIIRDAKANAFMSRDEQARFANSEKNLVDLDSRANESKGDSKMTDWLDSEKYGKKPADRFPINEDELRKRDKEAREEYERLKEEAEQKSIEAGKKSQKQEALRISGKALRAAIMTMLTDLLKEVIWKLISWLKKGKRTFEELGKYILEAVKNFFSNFKERVLNAGKGVLTTVLSAIYGPIVNFFNKIGMILKQGWKSLKEAYNYLKSEEAKKQPLSILIMQISKIFVTGLSAIGAISLGELIEKTLMTVPVFAIEIPLIGSLASIIGLFLGALTSGIAGAVIINFIDKLIANKVKSNIVKKQIDTTNVILRNQMQLNVVQKMHNEHVKRNVAESIGNRHKEAAVIIEDVVEKITNYKIDEVDYNKKEVKSDNVEDIDEMDKLLKNLGM